MVAVEYHWTNITNRLRALFTRDRWLAFTALIVMCSFAGAVTMFILVVCRKPSWLPWGQALFWVQLAIQGACYSVAGFLFIARSPRQFIGWLVLAVGTYFSIGPTLRFVLADHPPGGLGLIFLAWLIPILYYIPGTCDSWLLLWVPNGRLPSWRWRLFVALSFIVLIFEGVVQAAASPTLYGVHGVNSPLVSSSWAPIA
ncbi:MAG: hypothetical protein ACREP9_22235, partial [Candidatus Dormibacteraceae bacterium]